MSSRHTPRHTDVCPKPCCPDPGPKPDPCTPFIGRRGERGERGDDLVHTAYRNPAVYPITVVSVETDDIEPNPIPLANVFGGTAGTAPTLEAGVHHIRYQANLSWGGVEPISITSSHYLMTFVQLGGETIRAFRQSIPIDGDVGEDNPNVFLPTISIDFCVCTPETQFLSISTYFIRQNASGDIAPVFQVLANQATLSIDSALISEYEIPPIHELENIRGPMGYTGEAFNTTVFETPLLENELDSYGLVYDVDDPTANPLSVQIKFGRCVGYREPNGVGTFNLTATGYYRFAFSSTLNVDFVYPEDFDDPAIFPDLMQINLLASVNGGTPFIVTQLRTSVDLSSGAHKILQGFFERSFQAGDRVTLYIQYFLDIDPTEDDEWNVLLGVLSSRVPSVRTETKTIDSRSQALIIIEKMDRN